jgi:hypothetical protein
LCRHEFNAILSRKKCPCLTTSIVDEGHFNGFELGHRLIVDGSCLILIPERASVTANMGSEDDRARRINGLQPPYHYLQVATWVLFPVILVHYFAYLRPLLWINLADEIIVTLIFCLACAGALFAGYMTCATDPVDSALLRAAAGTGPPPSRLCGCMDVIETPIPASGDEGGKIYCYVCELNVDESSKHCRFCNKCITRFDHHCKWLNTCVGLKNYR